MAVTVGSVVDDVVKGAKALRSNKSINSVDVGSMLRKTGNFMLGDSTSGVKGVYNNLSKDAYKGNIKGAIKDAYMNGPDSLNYKAIAGTYVGAMAAGRVLSGGGVYRDSRGNANLPVVPFI